MNEDVNKVPVVISNWNEAPPAPKPLLVKHTSLKTWVIDPATTIGGGQSRWIQICDYEPSRIRMLVIVADNAVAITTDVPVSSPDPNTGVGTAPQGAYLPVNNGQGVEFFGPDAFYLNPLATATRVTVVKEYC